ncbi:hypothetical protein BH24BAC1_BH24BAC1_36950 [soil metagenome]
MQKGCTWYNQRVGGEARAKVGGVELHPGRECWQRSGTSLRPLGRRGPATPGGPVEELRAADWGSYSTAPYSPSPFQIEQELFYRRCWWYHQHLIPANLVQRLLVNSLSIATGCRPRGYCRTGAPTGSRPETAAKPPNWECPELIHKKQNLSFAEDAGNTTCSNKGFPPPA